MTRILAVLIAGLCYGNAGVAQDSTSIASRSSSSSDSWTRRSSVGLSGVMIDFDYPEHDYFGKYDFLNFSRMGPGVRLSYITGLLPMLDVGAHLTTASLCYPKKLSEDNYQLTTPRQWLGLDIQAIAKPLTDRYTVSPYIAAGLSAGYLFAQDKTYFYNSNRDSATVGNFSVAVPVSLGVNFRVFDGAFIDVGTTYRFAINDAATAHFQHHVGFVYDFVGRPRQRPVEKEEVSVTEVMATITDADRDGTPDASDRCPTIAGPADMGGCPDTDNDGIADDKDACPLVAGAAAFNGCPDTDGDGIADNTDKCPYVAGTAERGGCPVPDQDNDGFADDADRCPTQFSKTNNGCPEIRTEIINRVQQAAKAIFFETGKATLKKVSYKQLDAVVGILRDNPELIADIEGHTDDVGDDASNLTLSQNRAKAVVDYFVSKGIDAGRLESHGYGETQPIATNETAAGKAQNRRTEIKLRNYR